jgi:hypothetical protein
MGSFAVLAVNSILLLAVTVLLAYLVAANVNFKNALYRGIGKLNPYFYSTSYIYKSSLFLQLLHIIP